jgi:hypothetical protein
MNDLAWVDKMPTPKEIRHWPRKAQRKYKRAMCRVFEWYCVTVTESLCALLVGSRCIPRRVGDRRSRDE